MKILIVTAMEEELAPLLGDAKEVNIEFGNKIYKMDNSENEIYLSNLNIGKVNSAFNTTELINILNPDMVVNFGTAGGLAKDLNILDIVIASKAAYHDVDVRGFGYELGQVPGQELYFEINNDKQLVKIIEDKVKDVNVGLILSGDQFINDKQKSLSMLDDFTNPYAVDMESASIVDICRKKNKDVMIIRGISDLAHSESAMEFEKYLEQVVVKFNDIIEILKIYKK